jgi:hypothetical protein
LVSPIRSGLASSLDVDSLKLLNVLDYGAIGDGKTDDTLAFKSAIHALGTDGGTIVIPPGVYLIDPVQSIRPTHNITLALAASAILKAIPTANTASDVILIKDVSNVCITGGTIIGERYGHLGTGIPGGMGISVRGSSDIRIDGVTARDCWADGFYIGRGKLNAESRRVTINNCISQNNRRQGLSITACVGAAIENSIFSDTNGNEPQSGIDLENNHDMLVTDVTIRNCHALRNTGAGIQLVGHWRGLGIVTDSRVVGNFCSGNGRAGLWLARGTTDCVIAHNSVTKNGTNGLLIEQSSHNAVTANAFRENSRAPETSCPAVRLIAQSSHNVLRENSFGPKTPFATPVRVPNIVIDAGCLDNVVISEDKGADMGAPSSGKNRGSSTFDHVLGTARRARTARPPVKP